MLVVHLELHLNSLTHKLQNKKKIAKINRIKQGDYNKEILRHVTLKIIKQISINLKGVILLLL